MPIRSSRLRCLITIILLCSNTIFAQAYQIKESFNKLISLYNLDKKDQAFCYKLNSEIFGYNIDKQMRPASVTKIYTSYFALKNLGIDYRFKTTLYYENESIYIKGGYDSFFVTEHLFKLIEILNQKNITKVKNIYFDNHFYLNWSDDSIQISKQILKVFNTNNWDNNIQKTFKEVNQELLKRSEREIPHLNFEVTGIISKQNLKNKLHSDPIFTLSSSKMIEQLKIVNMYSNNFYTKNLFNFLGGQNNFQQFMFNEFNATTKDIRFKNGSGMHENYTTCKLTLKLNEKLESYLNNFKLSLFNLLPVPTVEEGTLKKRLGEAKALRKIAAKTGTLRHTSALSGKIYGKEDQIYFGIFNHTYETLKAREFQNDLILESIDFLPPLAEFSYEEYTYFPLQDILIQ